MIGLGHRDVLVIGVEPPAPATTIEPGGVVARRLRGYREAFASIGADIPDERVVVGPASIEGGMRRARRRLGGRHPPDRRAGDERRDGDRRDARRCATCACPSPGDVSVVGFDDIDLAQHVDPPLTTVHQPIRRKGEEAVRVLLSVVQRRDQAKPEHRRLETRLIVRGSTGPAPERRREEVAGA